MTSRHYAQFWDAAHAGQSARDDLTFDSTPPDIQGGAFKIYYIPGDDSSSPDIRPLLSLSRPGIGVGVAGFALLPGPTRVVVLDRDGSTELVSRNVTFSAMQEMAFTFNASAGTIEVSGATIGDGTATGTPWDFGDGIMQIGADYGGSLSANGYVSEPYPVAASLAFLLDDDGALLADDDDAPLLG
jgi:hypothetical protein